MCISQPRGGDNMVQCSWCVCQAELELRSDAMSVVRCVFFMQDNATGGVRLNSGGTGRPTAPPLRPFDCHGCARPVTPPVPHAGRDIVRKAIRPDMSPTINGHERALDEAAEFAGMVAFYKRVELLKEERHERLALTAQR